MSRDATKWGALLLLAVSAVMAFVVPARETASASALSFGSSGLFAARRYLEERGCDVRLLDRPLAELEPGGVLVLAFPWQRGAPASERAGIQQHLLHGGTLLLGYSGNGGSKVETEVMNWIGLGGSSVREEPPLGFLAWREYANEEWALAPVGSVDAAPLRISAPSRAPEAPAGAEIWYEGPESEPLVFAFRHLNGLVVGLPADVLSNARLLQAGNADLLESLMRSFGSGWSFDEYHHGLSAPLTADQKQPRFAFDLFLAHLAILHALFLWRLARRFGPVWSEKLLVSGSTRSFLVGLGSLHDQLGHHQEAAELLVRRARELDPGIALANAGSVGAGSELLELAVRVAREQARKGG